MTSEMQDQDHLAAADSTEPFGSGDMPTEDELDALDHQVAEAFGGVLDGDGWRFDPPLDLWGGTSFLKTKRSFCREWEYGGPVIERERIEIGFLGDGHGWQAAVNPLGSVSYSLKWRDGDTALIAAMRALVAKKQPATEAGLNPAGRRLESATSVRGANR